MSDPFAKVTTGQRLAIPAQAYNAFIDAALATRRASGGASASGGKPQMATSQTVLRVVNTTAVDLPPRSILGMDGALLDPATYPGDFLEHLDVKGVAPVLADHAGNRFVVTLDAIAAGTAGMAVVDGVTACQINAPGSADSASILWADIDDGETAHLIPAGSGSQVLWVADAATPESDSPELRWAIVRIGGGGDSSGLYKIQSIENDYLVCKTWDAENEVLGDDPVKIAKPWMLQHVVERYANLATLTTTDEQTVEIKTSDDIEATWKVTPTYTAEDLVQATARATGVDDDDASPVVAIALMDMNHDARAWAEVQPILEGT